MKPIHYADHLEQMLGEALQARGITFIHESQDKDKGLDFFLPDFDVYIEVKQYHSPRIEKQLTRADNIVVLQGKKAVAMFISLLGK